MEFKLECPQGQEANLFREVVGIIKGLEIAQQQGGAASENLKPLMEQLINQLGPSLDKAVTDQIFMEVRQQFGMGPVMNTEQQPPPQQQQPQQPPPQQQQPQQQQPPPQQQQPPPQQPQTEAPVIPLKGSVAMLEESQTAPVIPKAIPAEETENSEHESEGQS